MSNKKQYTYILFLVFFFLQQAKINACDVEFVVNFNTPLCIGDSNGNMYATVTSGVQPYLYSFDGGNTFSSENSIDNIPSGMYEVVVQDANGCEESEFVEIEEADPLLVNLGEDLKVELGEEVYIQAQIVGSYDHISWEFEQPQVLPCVDCSEIVLFPLKNQTIFVNVLGNGCIARDSIFIEVEKYDEIFIPNVFTPNGDGVNDFLTIYAGKSITKINKFQILDNWGNVVYEAIEFLPNSHNFGWDGNFDGKKMNPGIFVYCAEVEYLDGEVKTFCGDILLMY